MSVPVGATVTIAGERARLAIGSQIFEIPVDCVNVASGKVWIEMAADIAVAADRDSVTIMAMHPEPTMDQVLAWVDSLDPLHVAALMAEESSWGSLEDSIGLVAIRAVARAVRGEFPSDGR